MAHLRVFLTVGFQLVPALIFGGSLAGRANAQSDSPLSPVERRAQLRMEYEAAARARDVGWKDEVLRKLIELEFPSGTDSRVGAILSEALLGSFERALDESSFEPGLEDVGLGADASAMGTGAGGHAEDQAARGLEIERTLRLDSSGPDVARLQEFLGVEADGRFGPRTEQAVRDWQLAHGIEADGIVGPRTGRAMEDVAAADPSPAGTDAAVGGRELSGPQWIDRFPTSRSTDDLSEGFGPAVDRFLAALREAGARVSISATRRPPERAYLFHYCWRIAREGLDPASVPAFPGVEIEWVHREPSGSPDLEASRAAAEAMVQAAGLVHRAALQSRHIDGRAIDMTVTWTGSLNIRDASGSEVAITTGARTGADNATLHAVGATYGVIKLRADPPHWSDDGH